MDWYFVIRFLHVLSSIIFVGGIFGRQAIRSTGRKTKDIQTLASYYSAAGAIEKTMVIPGNGAVLLFGVILAIIVKAPIFGFLQGASQNWLLVTNILLIVGGLLVPFVYLPRGKVFEMLLEDAMKKNEITPDLQQHLNDPIIKLAHNFESTMLVLIVYLMVFKPF